MKNWRGAKSAFATALVVGLGLLSACATTATTTGTTGAASAATSSPTSEAFEADRAAILKMTGDYGVTFDFIETVGFIDGYELKPRYTPGGNESVRVIEDRGDFISLQHLLVVGSDEDPFTVKHWRQDWIYEPAEIWEFVGGNAWVKRTLSDSERQGKWAQLVYQVDDAPRYSGLAEWSHENGVSQWTSPPSLRPLPRRDATKRDDYHAILAVNRHALTPTGWVHEQDNSKLVLMGEPQIIAREIGVNTYTYKDDYPISEAEKYWSATSAFWAGVRAEWTRIESEHAEFGLTIQGEPEALYNPILEIANRVAEGEITSEQGVEEALAVIDEFTTTDIGDLQNRLTAKSLDTDY